MLEQEVIKAISDKDALHNNYFYKPLESCAVVDIDIKSSPGLTDVVNKQTKLNHAKPVDSEIAED